VPLAVDGEVIVAGDHADGEMGSLAGAAYVFRFDGATWVQEQKLLPDRGELAFGWAVAVGRDVIVVGARSHGFGAAYVFRFDGTSWVR
jgi:hypothetical protein